MLPVNALEFATVASIPRSVPEINVSSFFSLIDSEGPSLHEKPG